jgi:hypothetical protein
MKSLSSALEKKSWLATRPVSILDIVEKKADWLGLSRPFNLSELIRIFEIDPPLAPEIEFPQRGQVIDPQNVVIRWKDPGEGTHRQANSFWFILTKLGPHGGSGTGRGVDGRIHHIALPTLEYDAKYSVLIYGEIRPWPSPATERTFTTIKQPQQTVGYSKIIIFNCNTSKREVHVWLFDRNLQRWDNKGSIQQQYDEGGFCPGVGEEPFEIDLEDGHAYDLVCVDTGLIGCGVNDPTVQACQRSSIVEIVGKKDGFTLNQIIQ